MFNKTVSLKSGFPKLLGTLTYKNHYLRIFICISLITNIGLMIGVNRLLNREPTIITVSEDGLRNKWKKTELTTRAASAIREYLDYRHSWNSKNQKDRLSFAKEFVAPSSQKSFEKAVIDLTGFVKDKAVEQRFYIRDLLANSESKFVDVVADRFTDVQGLQAATTQRFRLYFETSTPSPLNPWGILINKEEELSR